MTYQYGNDRSAPSYASCRGAERLAREDEERSAELDRLWRRQRDRAKAVMLRLRLIGRKCDGCGGLLGVTNRSGICHTCRQHPARVARAGSNQ